jgi:hypothetical protein
VTKEANPQHLTIPRISSGYTVFLKESPIHNLWAYPDIRFVLVLSPKGED